MVKKHSRLKPKPVNVLEAQVRHSIVEYLGARPDVRIFSNARGNGWLGDAKEAGEGVYIAHPRRMTFGLFDGASDLIGWITIKGMAVFFSLEVKSPTGKPSEAQLNWIRVVKEMGGIAGVVRSVEDVVVLIDDYKRKVA